MSEHTKDWSGQLARFSKAVIDKALIPAAEKLIPQGALWPDESARVDGVFRPLWRGGRTTDEL